MSAGRAKHASNLAGFVLHRFPYPQKFPLHPVVVTITSYLLRNLFDRLLFLCLSAVDLGNIQLTRADTLRFLILTSLSRLSRDFPLAMKCSVLINS